jgi:transcription antitermination factor NusG
MPCAFVMNEQSADIPHWYPMRVTYSRELQAKAFLESVGVECFIPMRYEQIEGHHPRHQELRPAVRNLIFVHASQSQITEMKMTRREMAPLRYMMRPIHDDGGQTFRREIIVVPDRQMENFMRVASVVDDRVFYIENLDFAGKPGQRVRVVDGDFAGVEGIIKRVKKNKRVVVQIEHVAAVAIAFLPSAYIEILD